MRALPNYTRSDTQVDYVSAQTLDAQVLSQHPRYEIVVVSLVKVKKRSENFDKAKLKSSMKKAGAKDTHASKIADKIAGKVKPGTTTVIIRRWVITELTPLDSKAAKAYATYKKPKKKK